MGFGTLGLIGRNVTLYLVGLINDVLTIVEYDADFASEDIQITDLPDSSRGRDALV